jgi:hypothetical protein
LSGTPLTRQGGGKVPSIPPEGGKERLPHPPSFVREGPFFECVGGDFYCTGQSQADHPILTLCPRLLQVSPIGFPPTQTSS